jgi:uncharacterized iron-regulated membrane protein
VHKWLALVVGVQAVIWTLTGLYMTVVHIDVIHGDHFIRAAEARPVDVGELASPAAVAGATGGSGTVRLSTLLGRPVYIIDKGGAEALADARTGRSMSAPTKSQIWQIATSRFHGDEKLVGLALITDVPGEIRGRKPPLWRADFSGWNKPTLYISAATGELISRRHELWRVFDFVWMLHIMDYEERENVNNLLLRGFTLLALVTALSGAWLLFFAFPRKRRKATVQ